MYLAAGRATVLKRVAARAAFEREVHDHVCPSGCKLQQAGPQHALDLAVDAGRQRHRSHAERLFSSGDLQLTLQGQQQRARQAVLDWDPDARPRLLVNDSRVMPCCSHLRAMVVFPDPARPPHKITRCMPGTLKRPGPRPAGPGLYRAALGPSALGPSASTEASNQASCL